MKKLLILSAMAMSAGAIFADAIDTEGFESLTAGAVLTGDAATAFGDNWGTGVGSGSTEVEATVTAYGAEGAIATPAESRPSAFEGDTPNANYLAISTSTAPLYYYHDTNKGQASVADKAIYFDSVVQFTPTELTWDQVPDATQAGMVAGDKIAVWLANIEASGDDKPAATKLMITAGVNTSGETIDLTNFMADATVTAGTWYRLTIKATGDGKYDGNSKTTANFKVYVDGTAVSAGAVASDGTVGDPQTSFLSAVVLDTDILNVGFKGTGAVDDLVWTRDDPFAVEGAEFAIGTKQYKTFAAALAEAASGATIKMIANSGTDIVVTEGKNVTLDLNAYTLSAGISNAGTLTIVNKHEVNAAIVTGNVTNSGTLTIQEAFIAFTGSVTATTINGGYYTTKPTGTIPEGYGWLGTISGEDLLGDGTDTLYYYLDVSGETETDIVVPEGKTAEEVVAEATSATGIAITGDMDDVTISGSTITIGEKDYTVASFYNVTKGESALILTLDETKALATVTIDTETVDEEPFTIDTGVGLRVTVAAEAVGKLYYGLAYATGVSETFAAPTKVVKPSAAGTVNLSADKVGADAGFYKIWIDDVAPAGATIE